MNQWHRDFGRWGMKVGTRSNRDPSIGLFHTSVISTICLGGVKSRAFLLSWWKKCQLQHMSLERCHPQKWSPFSWSTLLCSATYCTLSRELPARATVSSYILLGHDKVQIYPPSLFLSIFFPWHRQTNVINVNNKTREILILYWNILKALRESSGRGTWLE